MSTPDSELVLAEEYDEDEVKFSLLGVINFLLRHRVLLVVTVALGLAVGLVQALTLTPWYEASVSFVSSSGGRRATAGVASALGPMDQGDPFDYYSRILSSAVVLDAVLQSELADGVTVRDRIRADSGAPEQEAGSARERLAEAGALLDSTNRLRRLGVLSVMTARAGWSDAQTAADLANAFVAALGDFDMAIRSAAATERRKFIESQVDDTFGLLTKAEEALRVFKEQNRLLASTGTDPVTGRTIALPIPPQLELRRDQLQREVNVQAELYLTLKKTFEQARIAELDEASALIIIEPAVPPRSRSGQSRRGMVMFMGVIGLLVGLGLAAVGELRTRVDLNSPDGVEFSGHLVAIHQRVSRVGARTVRALSAPSPAGDQQESKHDV